MSASAGPPAHVAVAEIGTNTTKCLVVRVEADGTFERVSFSIETTRIGRALEAENAIDRTSVCQTCRVINDFLTTAAGFADCKTFVFSTYALRTASNATDVIHYIAQKTGIRSHVISGADEAKFAYLSAKRVLSLGKPYTVIIDIGGGSTEVVLAHHGRILHTRSFALGALHLTEELVESDPIVRDDVERLTARTSTVVQRALDMTEISPLQPRQFDFVGSGGTITTAASMMGASSQPPVQVSSLRSNDVSGLLHRCIALPADERKRIPGLEPSRADIIVAGLTILQAFVKKTGKRSVRVNSGGVREGAVMHLLQNGLEW